MLTEEGQCAEPSAAIGEATATGHLIGGRYYRNAVGMGYVVLGRATVWECAPDAGTRVRWDNGNETITAQPATDDLLVGVDPGLIERSGSDHRRASRRMKSPALGILPPTSRPRERGPTIHAERAGAS